MLATVPMVKNDKTITVAAKLSHSKEVRDLATQYFAKVGFDHSWTNRLVLVVDELWMNAVKYGSRPGDTIEITFAEEAPDCIRFTITDSGVSGIAPAELKEKIQQHSDTHTPEKTSGRGLAIITNTWTDEFTISSTPAGGLIISFIKKIPTEAATPTSNTTSNTTSTPTGSVIQLKGNLDADDLEAKVAIAEEFVADEKNKILTLDLTEVPFINSSCIGKMAAWHATLDERGGGLRLVNLNPDVRQVLDLVGLTKILITD